MRRTLFATFTLLLTACGPDKVQQAQKQFDLTVIGKGTGTVTSEPAGILCGTRCTSAFDENQVVKLTASPGERVRWSGACQGVGSPSCEVKMNSAKAVNVTFLTAVSVNIVGSGRVDSAPAGVECANVCPSATPTCANSCQGGVDPDIDTTLTVTAEPGFLFTGWSGGCTGTGTCVVAPGVAADVTATFAPANSVNRQLVVNVVGSGTGSVVSSPGGISCPNSCNLTVPNDTVVTLTAATTGASIFGGWTGGCVSSALTCQVTMDAAKSVTARFSTLPVCGWAKRFGGTQHDRANSIAVNPNTGNILISGSVYGAVNFGGGNLTNVGTSAYNMYAAVFDPSGTHLASFGKGANGSVTLGESAAWLPDGSIVLAGAWSGNVNLGDGVRDDNVVTGGLFRGFVGVYDPGGAASFVKPLGATSNLFDGFCGMAVDPVTGNITVVGEFAEPESFGGPAAISPLDGPPTPDFDGYAAQYSSTGAFRWVRKLGGQYSDKVVSVAATTNGAVALVGNFYGSADFGNGAYPANTTDSAFVAKYDADGGYLSDRIFSPDADGGINGGRAVAFAPNGDLVVVGAISTQTDMGGTTLTSAGGSDAFVARYTPTGTLVFANRLGGPTFDEAYAVAVDNAGNVFVAGTYTGTVTFGTTVKTSAGMGDIFLVKYSPTGALQSVRTMGGTGWDIPQGLQLDAASNVLIAGYFAGTMTVGTTTFTAAAGDDLFVACMPN